MRVPIGARTLEWGLVVLLLAGGCARQPAPAAPVPAGTERPDTVAQRSAPAPLIRSAPDAPLPLPLEFVRAVQEGTRTLDGRPGPQYWQQRVDYRIDAELDPETDELSGQELVVYHNRSPEVLEELVLRLYQNLYAPGVPRVEPVPVTGGMTVERLVVGGREVPIMATGARPTPGRAGYTVDGTLMFVRLPRPVQPGDSVVLEVAWRFRVPPASAPRMGRDGDLYNIAQWYPQVAVYDDVRGWDTWPHLATGEFYLEYGRFDVSLTLPEGWLVGATGELQNAPEVLGEVALDRLERVRSADDVVAIVTEAELGAGRATQTTPGGQLTWVFTADNVRDFAWVASPHFVWDATRAIVRGDDGRPDTVVIHALYRPGAPSFDRGAEFARKAVEFFSERFGPYVYPQLTSAEGFSGGMEYPMMMFNQPYPDAQEFYALTAHEAAHQWYPIMVGSNEWRYAWQDEGLATYMENIAVAAEYPAFQPFRVELMRYLPVAGTELEHPIMRAADLFGPDGSYFIGAYSKPAVLLNALATIIGQDTLNAALREYRDRWFLRHPQAIDFFRTVEAVAGRDLRWFWRSWWYETVVLDQAIEAVELTAAGGGERAAITIADQGGAPMPVDLVLTLANGETRRITVPVDVWLSGARTHTRTVELPAALQRVEIDPEADFPDVDRGDNVWQRTGAR